MTSIRYPAGIVHFDDLRDDFGVDFKEIIKVVGESPAYEVSKRIWRQSGGWRKGTAGKAPKHYYECFINHLKRKKPEDILLARFAAIVLDARAHWTEACFDYRGGRTRIRKFRPSGLRDLPRLFQLLRKPLDTLRIWLRAKGHAIVVPLDIVPLDADLARVLLDWKQQSHFQRNEDWVFPNPATENPYWQEEIQKKHIKPAADAAGLGAGIGWHTFRHTYRTLLDEAGAPMKVQQELMRHASIQTTMNVYGQALSATKRQANSRVVRMVLKPAVFVRANEKGADVATP